MINRKYTNTALVAISILCPLIFPLACLSLFAFEGSDSPWWLRLLAYTNPISFLASGPIGLIAGLIVLVKNRTSFKNKYAWLWFTPLLLVICINLFISSVVLYWIFAD